MAESAKLEAGKIFVGGLSWDTTKQSLVEHFSQFGEVIDGVIMVDSVHKMPRGFGFVTFKDPASVTKVIETNYHTLDGKKIDPKEAITKDHHAASQICKSSSIDKKVFVGGLPHGCSVDEIKTYFGKFGTVAEVDVKIDRATSKPRGFAFVEYHDCHCAQDATTKQFHMFKDKKIEVKPAENRIPGASTTNYPPPVQWQGYPPSQSSPQGQSFNFYGYSQPTVGGYPSTQAGTYQAPQGYAHSHTAPQQPVYQHPQPSSYQQNGYQQYGTSPYQPQSLSLTGYNQPGYSATPGYTHQYSGSYLGQSDSVGYAATQSTSAYYPTTSYSSDNRYTQPQNQRNW